MRGTSGLTLLLLALQGHMEGHGQVVGSWHSRRDLTGSLGSGVGLSYLSSSVLPFLLAVTGVSLGAGGSWRKAGAHRGSPGSGMKQDSGDDTRDRAGRTGGRDWWQDLRHQHINESAHSEANRNLHLLLPENIPVLGQDQGSQPLLTPSMVMVSSGGTLEASPGCPGTPPPYLSPDSLFCVEEEEETVEDLESAEALLAEQAPCQRAVTRTNGGSTPEAQPSEGPGSRLSHPHPAQHPPLFLAILR